MLLVGGLCKGLPWWWGCEGLSSESRPESARAMSSKCDRFSWPVASVRHEDLNELEDLDDLDSVRSGGELGSVSWWTCTEVATTDMVFGKEWTQDQGLARLKLVVAGDAGVEDGGVNGKEGRVE